MQSFEIQNTQNQVSSSFFKKKFLKGYSKIHELKLVSIGLASPEKIQSWAEKELPNGKIFGEVTNANTFHYRTFQPTKGGLFCERIFGPLKDFECACGKRQKPTALESKKILEHKQTTRYFCSNCDVEYTWSIIRRYQLGYIKLNAPVTHLWYLKTNPSYLSIFFDMKRKDLEAVVYCTDCLTLENVWKYEDQKTLFSGSISDLYTTWQKSKNFIEKKQNFYHHFEKKKQKKRSERNSFFLCFQKTESVLFSKNPEKKKILKKKREFSSLFHSLTKEENLSPVQLKISTNIEEKKKQIFLTSLFEKMYEKNLKKTYGNNLLKIFSRKFFLTQFGEQDKQLTLRAADAAEKNILVLFCFGKKGAMDSFFPNTKKTTDEKKKRENIFLFFFFLFHFSMNFSFYLNSPQKFSEKKKFLLKNQLHFAQQKNEEPELSEAKKTYTKSKRYFFFLLIMVSFLKKYKKFESSFSKKKQKKKLSFKYQLQELVQCFFFPTLKNTFKRNSKIAYTPFENIQRRTEEFIEENSVSTPELLFFFFENTNKILFNKKKTVFLLHPFEKNAYSFCFTKEKSNLTFSKESAWIMPWQLNKENNFTKNEKSLQKNFFEISNPFVFSKKKKSIEKKEKKLHEFFRSGFVLSTFKNERKSKREKNISSFEYEKVLPLKTSYTLSNKRIYKTRTQKKNGDKFLKNPLFTIGYNFMWKNDSDWKYFVYYNSFFFSEFEDIPLHKQLEKPWTEAEKNSLDFSSALHPPGLSPGTEEGLMGKKGEKNQSMQFLSSFQKSQKQTQVGAGILEKLLTEYTPLSLKKMIKQHQILLPKINKVIRTSKQMGETSKKESLKIQKYIQKREHIVRRFKFLRKFFRKNSNPTFMILRNLPVLPPDLRPILKLENQIAASDLNRFYQRILYRNERLQKFSKDSATNQSFELRYAQRLLQEAVDNLIQNGKGGVKPETNSRGIPLKSLSEILKGKQGRFRQYLLGKRVDYSGRSVIVVGPKLKIYECGLPKEMAFELFLPFLIGQILQLNLAKTVIGAKNLLKKDSTFAFLLLKKIMKNIPVLLNRAPTLHRLGFQAFLPKLIEGRAILLHPMVCPGFNADFDGDQMAVHVPLTVEARAEAWKFMLSTNNFMNSATGDPVLLPTQDMVLGLYYLTTDFHAKSAALHILNSLRKKETLFFYDFQKKNKNFLFFSNFSEVLSAYQRKEISLHSPIWIRWNGFVDFGNDSTKPLEIQVRKNGFWHQIHPKMTTFSNQKNEIFSKFIKTTPGRIFMNSLIREFQKNENFQRG
jgi:DNA-directed RNA polymerase beta' subunit